MRTIPHYSHSYSYPPTYRNGPLFRSIGFVGHQRTTASAEIAPSVFPTGLGCTPLSDQDIPHSIPRGLATSPAHCLRRTGLAIPEFAQGGLCRSPTQSGGSGSHSRNGQVKPWRRLECGYPDFGAQPAYFPPNPAKPLQTPSHRRRITGGSGRNTMDEGWLSVDEIARYLGVSNDTVRSWITHKGMPGYKVGRFWKFKREDVDAWV